MAEGRRKRIGKGTGKEILPPFTLVSCSPGHGGRGGETAGIVCRVTAVRPGVRHDRRTSEDLDCGDRRTPPRRGGASGHRVVAALLRVIGVVVQGMAGEG